MTRAPHRPLSEYRDSKGITDVRKEYGFETSKLPAAALRDFDAVQSIAAYSKGILLFTEKQDSHGIFMVCEGAGEAFSQFERRQDFDP
jgi:hypothetical protein